uniref:Uncharacterized protein n=1 Tax=Pithovirus LCPAC001 TaxID=2506585 RepID=A0A481Z1G2_9VIRU|nr:MAG: hypothetical protein LCPAC001_00520 [Pithovirus LCPAC001]
MSAMSTMSTVTCPKYCDWNPDHRMVVRMETPLCTEEQARTAITNFVSRANVYNLKTFMNYGTARDSSYAGFLLVWFGGDLEDAYKIYNLILGRNADGTVRCKFIPNEEYRRIEDKIEELLTHVKCGRDCCCWSDVSDLEDSLIDHMDVVYMKPIIKAPTFRLNTEQSRELNANFGVFNITPVLTHNKIPSFDRNDKALFAQRVPVSLSLNFLKRKLDDMCHQNYSVVDSSIRTGRCLTVYFDSTGDCNLFRTMFRVFLADRKKVGFLIFNYCFKTKPKTKFSPQKKSTQRRVPPRQNYSSSTNRRHYSRRV